MRARLMVLSLCLCGLPLVTEAAVIRALSACGIANPAGTSFTADTGRDRGSVELGKSVSVEASCVRHGDDGNFSEASIGGQLSIMDNQLLFSYNSYSGLTHNNGTGSAGGNTSNLLAFQAFFTVKAATPTGFVRFERGDAFSNSTGTANFAVSAATGRYNFFLEELLFYPPAPRTFDRADTFAVGFDDLFSFYFGSLGNNVLFDDVASMSRNGYIRVTITDALGNPVEFESVPEPTTLHLVAGALFIIALKRQLPALAGP